jgi:hypothetical protein
MSQNVFLSQQIEQYLFGDFWIERKPTRTLLTERDDLKGVEDMWQSAPSPLL